MCICSEWACGVRVKKPFTLKGNDQARLVFQLVIPTLCPIYIAQVMNQVLGFFRIRLRPDDAHLYFHAVEKIEVIDKFRLAVIGQAEIAPSSIRTIISDQVRAAGI